MKRLIQMIVLLSGIAGILFLMSCGSDDTVPPKWCLEPPCGMIDPEATNVTLFIEKDFNIGNIGIVIDEQDSTLSLNGRDLDNNKPFTCWQTVPTISSSSSVVLVYELGEEVVVGALNVSGIGSNQLVIEIDGETARISDYVVCSDNIVM